MTVRGAATFLAKRIVRGKIVIPIGVALDNIEGCELAGFPDSHRHVDFPQFHLNLVRQTRRCKSLLERCESVLECGPIVRGVNNCHLLGESNILHQNLNTKIADWIKIPVSYEYIWAKD